jgi:hypothetical protein
MVITQYFEMAFKLFERLRPNADATNSEFGSAVSDCDNQKGVMQST